MFGTQKQSRHSTPPAKGFRPRSPGFFATKKAQEAAYREALNRHLSEMEVRAGEAIRGRQEWESHVSNCLAQEASEFRKRKELQSHNADFISQQILWNEQKRSEERKRAVIGASAHAFPTFSEPPESELSSLVKRNKERMRYDLDLQVRTNNALRDLAKEKERALEDAQMRANLIEMQQMREHQHARKEAEKRKMKILASILDFEDAENTPVELTIAPASAVQKLLAKTGVKKEEIARWEINEAFAVVALANARLLGLAEERLNANGGAVALGHPLGASGTRIVGSLLGQLEAGQLGCAAICNGGGGASAVLIKKE
jgi:hypothetical protein